MYMNMKNNTDNVIDRFMDKDKDTFVYDKYMPLDERDIKLVQLENAKQKVNASLLEKHFLISEKVNKNIYLGGVARKYSEYYNEVLKQREDQINALKTLYEHIEDIKDSSIVEGSDKKRHELGREQKIINREINEIEKLRKEILKKN